MDVLMKVLILPFENAPPPPPPRLPNHQVTKSPGTMFDDPNYHNHDSLTTLYHVPSFIVPVSACRAVVPGHHQLVGLEGVAVASRTDQDCRG